jgi:flagellar motility protein MotE (MotC chaperone)
MKIVLIVLGAVTVFTLTLVGMLAATGNLNQDALDRLMGKEVEAAGEAGHGAGGEHAATEEPVDPITKQIMKQREELASKERELKDYEQQLNQRAAELDALYQQVQTAKQEFEASVGAADAARQMEIEAVANTVSNMKPAAAAERLENMPIPDMVAVLRAVKDKNRGKIVEAMSPETASEVLRKMQEPAMLPAATAGEGGE